MRVLVTGAGGFIGGALAAALAGEGWQVRVSVRPGRARSLPVGHPYELAEADLENPTQDFAPLVKGCDLVYHAAAIRNRWGTQPQAYVQANVEATRRLLQASADRVGRFVYVSSVGVMGWPGVQGIDESFPLLPLTGQADYHKTKAEAERLTLGQQGVPATVVRPTITYGPGDLDGMLTRLIAMLAGGKYVQVGRGSNHVHLTYIDDLLRGLLLAGTHPAALGESFIIGGPSSIAMRDLVALIEKQLALPRSLPRTALRSFYVPEALARPLAWGVESAYRVGARLKLLPPGAVPPLSGDKIDTVCIHRGFSSAKAARMLGYAPRVGYAEGLAKTIEWLTATGRLRQPISPSARRPTSEVL